MPSLGERIRAARKRAGLSHDTLAARVGTSRQHLIRLEKGIHHPKPEMLSRIAEALGCTVEDLADADDEESDPVGDLMDALMRVIDLRTQVRR